MERPKLEVADVFRRYGAAYREAHDASLSMAQRRVMTAIEVCRTAALGGHLEQCDACGHQRISYNSCRNRHCNKCQSLARAEWIEDRLAEILETQYFHVVFTLPEEIAAIHHPHLHCVIPGGGLSPDGRRWIPCRNGFFLTVRVLSRLFRRLFLEQLQAAFNSGQLQFFSALQELQQEQAFARYLAPVRNAEWYVYAKPPFAGPQQVLDYV